MVKFAVVGTESQARMFLSVLTNVHPDASEAVVTTANMKVVVPAKAILLDPPAREGATRVTLRLVFSTGNVQTQTSSVLEAAILEKLRMLESIYVNWLRAPPDAKPTVQIVSPVVNFFQAGTHRAFKESVLEDRNVDNADWHMHLPSSAAYIAGMMSILGYVDLTLIDYPQIRSKLLAMITEQFVPDAKRQCIQQVLLHGDALLDQDARQQAMSQQALQQQASSAGVQSRDDENWTIA